VTTRRALTAIASVALLASCQSRSDDKLSRSGLTSRPGSSAGSQSPLSEPAAPPRAPVPPLPSPLPGTRTDLTAAIGSSSRAVIADLDGDGDREIVAVDAKTMHVLDNTGREISSAPVAGGIQTLIAADLDGDKRSEIYAGWGQSREHMDAKARVTAHRFEKGKLVEETVLAPETERPEVVAIVPMLDTHGLLVAYFDSKYMVTSMTMSHGAHGWTGEKIASLRTATSYARGDVDGDGTPDIIVGRVYGDDRGIDGDAFVLGNAGTRTPIPSTRGLRSLALADADGDGHLDIFMGDGWHQNYGQNARGLLTWSRHQGTAFTSDIIEDTAGQYELSRILPAQIGGGLALVTLGSHYVRVFVRRGGAWQGTTIGGPARDIAVGDLDGTPGDEILIVGDTSEVVDLAAALKP
jgi:hypothetical protein